MIILLSPAKTLDFDSSYPETPTRPPFAADASRLARAASEIGPKGLGELMHISDDLALLNHQRFKRFGRSKPIERPAIRAFAGDVYRGFDATSADADTIDYAQDHLRILSGLYGILRPRDAIRPYRLEMGTRWSPEGGKLVDHWGDRVAKRLASDLRRDGSNVLINLASNEYFAVVKDQLPKRVRIIAPDFRNRTAKGLQFQSFPAKVARGTMARWLCEERVEDADALPHFDRDGWRFDADGSTPDRPLFVKG
ncbi:YaaA family protein [Sphingomonas sp. LY160]|uniref:YaaA family protein n=1 Tax=Sphingomonas sp. LY160 TaxID=3095342 RepID=UPI002ADED977|nr:YaaA family protein [Sphingomonas sp. LY160]MEA1071192.1 YaaA family protein [Sphingomonas sp. LY160]